jgi:large subunit ribosomal protein L21
MYAVFRAGGKQYRASEGARLRLEKLDAEEGSDVSFDEVLLVGEGSDVQIGTPLLSGTTVSAKVLRKGRGGKIGVTKFRRRQNYLRRHTHRQWFTEVEITAIGGAKAPSKPQAPAGEAEASGEKGAEAEAAPAKKATRKKTAAKSASGKKTARKTSEKTSTRTTKKSPGKKE